MREQSGRLALFYFATVDSTFPSLIPSLSSPLFLFLSYSLSTFLSNLLTDDVYGFELLYTLERLVAHEVNFDPLIEAGLPSTLAKFVHLLFSVPSSLLDAGLFVFSPSLLS